jgi:hypothetical protein
MARIPFDSLPDSARIWTFGVQRDLTPQEEERLLRAVDEFLDGWTTHGTPLRGGRSWYYGRLLVVGVDEAAAPPSGCSIDALVHALQEFEVSLDTRIVDNSMVWFKDGDEVRCDTRPGFRSRVESGSVDPRTTVFDTSVIRLGDLRRGAWEAPAEERWHGKAFFRSTRPSD